MSSFNAWGSINDPRCMCPVNEGMMAHHTPDCPARDPAPATPADATTERVMGLVDETILAAGQSPRAGVRPFLEAYAALKAEVEMNFAAPAAPAPEPVAWALIDDKGKWLKVALSASSDEEMLTLGWTPLYAHPPAAPAAAIPGLVDRTDNDPRPAYAIRDYDAERAEREIPRLQGVIKSYVEDCRKYLDRIAALEAVLRDEAISLLANAYDNLNDMPISEDWAAKTAKRILELLDRIDELLKGKTNGDDGTYLHSPDGGPL